MKKTAVIFAGQGSQYEKQGALLYEKFPEIRDIYDDLGEKLKQISFEGSIKEISQTENLQPIMVAFQLAVLRLIKDKVPNISATCGLSLGEYSAITLAGIVDEKHALRLVKKRGELMGEASKKVRSKMLAFVNASAEQVRELIEENGELNGRVYVANINAPTQIVASGEDEAVDILKEKAREKRFIAKPLAVSGAFHTPFMESARTGFCRYIKEDEFDRPVIDYYPNLTGEKYNGQDMKEVLPNQITSPVLLYKTFENMVNDGINHFVEIGPGGVLSNIIRRNFNGVAIEALKNDEDVIAFLSRQPD